MTQRWSPARYAHHAPFVPELGASILDRLAPSAGERVLDLGCGDGALTARIAALGASVVAIDASSDMVAAARARGLDARVMDATGLTFDSEFDAVFSNAVLHWVRDPGAALRGVTRALKPGGRFVAEFGAHTNIAAISVAIRSVLERRRIAWDWPWYYPTPDEYGALVDANGMTVRFISSFSRPTPLPTGIAGWLATFAVALLDRVPAQERTEVEEEIAALLAPSLRDASGQWTADYVRLQVEARKR